MYYSVTYLNCGILRKGVDLPVDKQPYTYWNEKVAPEIEIDAESFEYLFDAGKKPGTHKDQTSNFLKAYAKAVYKIAIEENQKRFPNLKEIQEIGKDLIRSENQKEDVVYPLAQGLIDETEFFEKKQVRYRKGGKYLIPKAKRFKDKSGKYSDLIFDFENGTVKLPELKKTDSKHEKIVQPVPSEPLSLPDPAVISEALTNASSADESSVSGQPETRIPGHSKLRKSVLLGGLITVVLILIVILFFVSTPMLSSPEKPFLKEKNVIYSIYDSNDSSGSFLMFELSNPNKINVNSTIVFPKINFTVKKGTVSISHPSINDTTIKLNTNDDAMLKLDMVDFQSIPFVITHKYEGIPNLSMIGINKNDTMKIGEDEVLINLELKKFTYKKIIIEQQADLK